MITLWRRPAFTALALALAAWPAVEASAQGSGLTAPVSTAEIVRSVQANPAGAARITAEAVATGKPDSAGTIVGAVVGVLQPSDRRALAPTIVTAAIAALPAAARTSAAPSCTCSAIRAVPVAEQPGVVPAIISAAVALAPQATNLIVTCAIEAAPTLVAAINAAASSPAVTQLEGGAPPSTPLPGSSIGIESTLPANQSCASPPCPG